ncbi:MAG: hypothetical protein ACRCXD_01110 [Luteolibacter sp.]
MDFQAVLNHGPCFHGFWDSAQSLAEIAVKRVESSFWQADFVSGTFWHGVCFQRTQALMIWIHQGEATNHQINPDQT